MSCANVLFVSNGHGEVAIAKRIAAELPATMQVDHLALVASPEDGAMQTTPHVHPVGPRRAMPSGGLIAMGNVKGIIADLRAGLLGLTLAQLRLLRAARGSYAVSVAIGDVYALLMALQVRAPATIFVGTAKSAYVAPYGPFERRILGRATTVFVRDDATARALHANGIAAQSANVIVDLYDRAQRMPETPFEPLLAVFPGSREGAYAHAVALCAVVAQIADRFPKAGAFLSVAPWLDASRMIAALEAAGWDVRGNSSPLTPFTLQRGDRELVRAWSGSPGAMLHAAALVLGQAGTANEAAAAAGIPIVALRRASARDWYRQRQIGLLGEALLVVDTELNDAAGAVARLLEDPHARLRMSRAGRERMGSPGGARRIADAIMNLRGAHGKRLSEQNVEAP